MYSRNSAEASSSHDRHESACEIDDLQTLAHKVITERIEHAGTASFVTALRKSVDDGDVHFRRGVVVLAAAAAVEVGGMDGEQESATTYLNTSEFHRRLLALECDALGQHEALKQLVMHNDSLLGAPTLQAVYEAAVLRRGFCSATRLQPLLIALGERHTADRALVASAMPESSSSSSAPEASIATNTFDRTSIKFWVRPANVVRLCLEILPHLPVYSHEQPTRWAADTTSVYLDAPQHGLPCYHTRLEREEGSRLIRMRWYEANKEEVFVERKTHHESWVGASSIKERARCPSDHILSYLLDGVLPAETSEKDRVLLKKIRRAHQRMGLRPVMRTAYARTAFQATGSDAVRISLDTDLRMLKEHDLDPNMHWKTPEADFTEADVHKFPFAVLEVKLHRAQLLNPPAWLRDLMGSKLVIQAEKFSKFSQGTAILYPQLVAKQPYWLTEVGHAQELAVAEKYYKAGKSGLLADARELHQHSAEDEGEYSLGLRPLKGGDAGGSGGGVQEVKQVCIRPKHAVWRSHPKETLAALCACGGGKAAEGEEALPNYAKKRAKIEPKSYLANERTWLQWFNTSGFVAAVALLLLATGNAPSMVLACTFIVLAILLQGYAAFVYRWRVFKLQNRHEATSFGDPVGPTFLTIASVFIVVVNGFIYLGQDLIIGGQKLVVGDIIVAVIAPEGLVRGFQYPMSGVGNVDDFYATPFVDTYAELMLKSDTIKSKECDYGLELPPFYEPSGIAYDRVNHALYIHSDKGALSKIDVDSRMGLGLWVVAEPRINTEDITIVKHGSGVVWLVVEGEGRIVEFDTGEGLDPSTGRVGGRVPRMLRTFFIELPEDMSQNRGAEGLVWVPNSVSAEGGYMYVGTQANGQVYIYELTLSDPTAMRATLVSSFEPLAGEWDLTSLSYFNNTLVCSFPRGHPEGLVTLHPVDPISGLPVQGAPFQRYVVDVPDAEGVEIVEWPGFSSSKDKAVAFACSDSKDAIVRLGFVHGGGFRSCY